MEALDHLVVNAEAAVVIEAQAGEVLQSQIAVAVDLGALQPIGEISASPE